MKKYYLTTILIFFLTSIIAASLPQTLFSASSDTQVTLIISDGLETPTPTPTTSTAPSTIPKANTISNTNSSTVCKSDITGETPDLFEIRTNKNTATLFFTPPTNQYTSFYIAFSRKPDYWEYGVEFNQTKTNGVLKYTINLLEPNTKYYFRIRSGNNCATGNWSNIMTGTTTSNNQTATSYKSFIKSTFQKINEVIKKLIPSLNPTASPTPSPRIIFSTQTPTANPTQISVLKFPTPSQKHNFCILWWCFDIPWLK